MKKIEYSLYVGAVAIIVVAIIAILGAKPSTETLLGGYLTSTVTATKANVNSTSTSVVSTGANLQKLVIQNGTVAGGADVYCSFGVGATSTWGLYLSFATSSPNSYREITDPNLLQKGMNCIGSTTLTILKY